MSAGRLEGKVAVITGAGGEIGGVTASLFASQGAAVVVHDLVATAAARRVDEISADGGHAMAYTCDVADSAAIESMFDAAAAAFGPVDVLMNCAGTSGVADVKDPQVGPIGLTDEDWSRMLAIHLNGSFFCTRALVRRLVAEPRPGSVICVSSIAGLAGWGDVHYSTAKGGLLGFMRSLARMYGPAGIRFNAVCPGVIDAGMTHAVPAPLLEPLRAMTPLGRYGSAEDVANACLYLASDESAFVTGQWLSVNGGLHIG